jgi:putative molybdopterin biosynthesis protein
MERLQNRLVELRQKHGLKQQEVAARAGITRQSLSNLETGRSAPSTTLALRLAQALGCRIEDLFWLEDPESRLVAEVAGAAGNVGATGARKLAGPHGGRPATKGDRVLIVSVGEKWVAHPIPPAAPHAAFSSADGILAGAGGTPAVTDDAVFAKVALLRERKELRETLLCVGCAPALGVLAARASARSGAERVLWLERSSSAALELLGRGQAHVAGAHLLDEASGEFNVPFVQRLLPGRAMLVFNLVWWEAGLLVAPGNPRGIRRVEDLARPDVSIVPREAGAGAQKLLERMLRRAGIAADDVRKGGPVAAGHMDVARAVAMGVADAGMSIRSAALAFGLDFLPLAEERFDLVVSQELSGDPRVIRLLDTLSSKPFRREIESLGGYGVRESGHLVSRTDGGGKVASPSPNPP